MPEETMRYTIRVREHLIPEQWETWLGGLTLEILPSGEMQLSGPVADQAALHGILTRIRDLGLTLTYLEGVSLSTD
ncbi:MAG TPA: hypothetical protein PKZ84_05930 [Anaerolineae bacterium]|nr:hypothetical protein [Anaerolineae bacterium]HQI84076.1 hypothetical protein [Anaerolineae bacterium]